MSKRLAELAKKAEAARFNYEFYASANIANLPVDQIVARAVECDLLYLKWDSAQAAYHQGLTDYLKKQEAASCA